MACSRYHSMQWSFETEATLERQVGMQKVTLKGGESVRIYLKGRIDVMNLGPENTLKVSVDGGPATPDIPKNKCGIFEANAYCDLMNAHAQGGASIDAVWAYLC